MWYAVTRCAVLLMSPGNIKGKLICVTVDAVVYVVLNIAAVNVAMQYIFWPGTIIAAASGSIRRAAYILAAEILLAGYLYIVRSVPVRIKNGTGLYCFSGMAVLMFFLRGILMDSISECLQVTAEMRQCFWCFRFF